MKVLTNDYTKSYNIGINKPSVDPITLRAWQSIVDTLAEIAHVPAALIMQVHPQEIEVFLASEQLLGHNPYESGEKANLGTGLYCETVLKTKKELLVKNALKDDDWKENPDIELGMIFYYGMPILWPDNTAFGTLCILDRKAYYPSIIVKKMMEVLRENIEVSLELLCKNQEVFNQEQQSFVISQKLNKALEQTIMSLCQAMSWRDPYTAQHQKRVGTLALELADILGFSEDEKRGLYFGAIIHDIGKIYIPAEILNRPGRLSKAEFEMIRSHPTVGAEIVHDIEFPWPVKEMILQHHERLDGSGYPNHLKGDEITLEARILAVADVVEAISSHRPYRSSLGMEAALLELEVGRGSLYDADVVNACLFLFRDENYSIPDCLMYD